MPYLPFTTLGAATGAGAATLGADSGADVGLLSSLVIFTLREREGSEGRRQERNGAGGK